MNDVKKISIVTNFNIQEKLVAAAEVADKLSAYVDKLYIPSTYKDRIMRAHQHKPQYTYLPVEEMYAG